MSLIYGSTNGHRLMWTLSNAHWLPMILINSIRAWPNFRTRAGFVPGSVQLIRPSHILSLGLAHSTARPNRQAYEARRMTLKFESVCICLLMTELVCCVHWCCTASGGDRSTGDATAGSGGDKSERDESVHFRRFPGSAPAPGPSVKVFTYSGFVQSLERPGV